VNGKRPRLAGDVANRLKRSRRLADMLERLVVPAELEATLAGIKCSPSLSRCILAGGGLRVKAKSLNQSLGHPARAGEMPNLI
jgi:hypothetical protein